MEKAKPLILAKGALNDAQLSVKERIGCDGLEIQLLGEMIVNREDFQYKHAEHVYDLSNLLHYDVKAVHAPLLPGTGDVTLERLVDDGDNFLLEQIFYIADKFGKEHNRKVIVVMHSESFHELLVDVGGTYNKIVCSLDTLLDMYENTELVIENVSPLRGIGKGKELHLANNFAFDNVVLADRLRTSLGTDRIGVCLDTCHQMLTEKYITGLYQMVGDVPIPNLSMETFFMMYMPYCKLIHLCDMKGSGYGKGRHGVPFGLGTYDKMVGILDLYHKYNYTCPITLEVEETDFAVSDGYASTKKLVEQYYKYKDNSIKSILKV